MNFRNLKTLRALLMDSLVFRAMLELMLIPAINSSRTESRAEYLLQQ